MGKCWGGLHGLKPVIIMVGLQFLYAVMNMLFKLAIEDGSNIAVLVTYRMLCATAFIGPLALFLERKTRPKLTKMILFLGLLSGLFGGFLPLTFMVKSMAMTSATFSSAMSNLTPVITFVLSLCFRLETLGIKRAAGKAKVLGTCMSIGGGMMLTFYKGVEIRIWETNINLLDLTRHISLHKTPNTSQNSVSGALFSLGGSVSFAIWLIVQIKLAKIFPCHYSSTALMCLTASILAAIYSLCTERKWSDWRMTNPIGIITAIYSGIVAFGLGAVMISWCAKERGPLFVSTFSPLAAIIIVVAANLFLDEKLYLGSFLGAILIILGLYTMLWGKNREMKMMRNVSDHDRDDNDAGSRKSSQDMEENNTIRSSISSNNGGSVIITVNGDGSIRNMRSTEVHENEESDGLFQTRNLPVISSNY